MSCSCIVLSSISVLPCNLSHQFEVLFDDDIDELPMGCTRLVWISGRELNAKECDIIESACLLKEICIVLVGEQELGFPNFESDVDFTSVYVCGDPLRLGKLDMVLNVWEPFDIPENCIVSSKCWGNESICSCEKQINFANCSNMNLNQVVALSKSLGNKNVVSISDIFENRTENVFHKTNQFIEHFERMIYFARVLGAKRVIYKGGCRIFVSCPTKQYHAYTNAHGIFVEIMQHVADYAASLGIDIYVQDDCDSNYCFECDHVVGIVEGIDRPNLKVFEHLEDFMLEYDGSKFTNPAALLMKLIGI